LGQVRDSAAPVSNISRVLPKILIVVIVLALLSVIGFFAYRYWINRPPALPAANQNVPLETKPAQSKQPVGVTTPDDWQQQYFGNLICQEVMVCGDERDPDRDGLLNSEEYKQQTDPNNPDSDNDGLADGDEALVFKTSALKLRTASDPEYSDTDYVKGGYDVATGDPFTAERLALIRELVKQYGLHEPTTTTLGDAAFTIYGFGEAAPASSDAGQLPATIDSSPEAMLDRDTQRQDTIKKLGAALLKYKADKNSFPDATNFTDMVTKVKPYNIIATNPVDPINKDQYVYTYATVSKGQDFTMTYFSETQKQIIKYTALNAQKDVTTQSANGNDERRATDLESIRSALLVYSATQVAGNQEYVFPTKEQYKTALVPEYLSSIPKDPKTNTDYDYQVSATFDSFTLKAVLENPPPGTTGISCNQEECRSY
jgi:hypothetical protein